MNQCIEIRMKYAHNSVDIGNNRYTYVQYCILLKYRCDTKNVLDPLIPKPFLRPYVMD